MRSLIRPCGLTDDDVQPVALSANVGAAMIAGQLTFGVLHMDDIPVIEGQLGRELTIVARMREVNPVNHYLVLITHRATLEENRDAFVRLVAAHIDTIRWMQDPANYEEIAEYAQPTGRAPDVAKWAVEAYNEIGFWPDDAGLTPENIQAVTDVQQRVGGIREGRTPVGYEQLTDLSVYEEALQLVEEQSGR
jgi:ABC-type nitrate/sulfonate/bicarbonate transport system substrate-binding protein